MPCDATISRYRAIQAVARQVLGELAPTITEADTEASIARRAVEALGRRGITDTWYYDCPALVLLGTRSCISISGRNYTPALEEVGVTNLVTIDLSPRRDEISGEIWGDCARSFAVENGRHTSQATDHSKLSALPFFTFEPHVRRIGGSWGFKHEDIFFFGNSGRVERL